MAAGVGTAGNLSTIYNIYTCRVSAGRLVARYPLFVQTLLFAREHFYPEMVQQATTQCGTIVRQILCGNVMLPVVSGSTSPYHWAGTFDVLNARSNYNHNTLSPAENCKYAFVSSGEWSV